MSLFIIEFPEGFSLRTTETEFQREIYFFNRSEIKREMVEKLLDLFQAKPKEIKDAYDEGYQDGKEEECMRHEPSN